jgi:tRNA(Ile)-lysidine synthetase-like protein
MDLLEFWKSHPDYWFPKKDKNAIDLLLFNTFKDFEIKGQSPCGKIIFFDQLQRHFVRVYPLENNDEYLKICSTKGCEIFEENISNFIDSKCEVEIVFGLMPFKHLKRFHEIFHFIHNTWKNKPTHIKDMEILHRFYTDTYNKGYIKEFLCKKSNSINSFAINNFQSTKFNGIQHMNKDIFEYFPDNLLSFEWLHKLQTTEIPDPLLICLNNYLKDTIGDNFMVSLSGGVDSIVLVTCLKKLGKNVCAIHIVYGNRSESRDEANFLYNYCLALNIPFFIYEITWLRRDQVDREFYEKTTRDLRFLAYEKVISISSYSYILLGHIKDDLVENVWNNISKCINIENLKKMKTIQQFTSITGNYTLNIHRPFLNTTKDIIIYVSKILGIPYFKNTTPEWSQRGKFRNHFYEQAKTQFGDEVHNKILEFSDIIQSQNNMINKILINPILCTMEISTPSGSNTPFYDKQFTFDFSSAIKLQIAGDEWVAILDNIFKKIGVSRPSLKCIRIFTQKLNLCRCFKFQIKKNILCVVNNCKITFNVFN